MRLSTRLTAAMVGLVLLTAIAIGVLTDRNLAAVILPHELNRIDTHTRLAALELEVSVRNARADIVGFRSAVAVDGIVRAALAGGVDPLDHTTLLQWRDRLAGRFVAELSSKLDYSQFRVIGIADGGREIVRVDRSGPGETIRIVPDNELRRQSDRGFFQRAMRLSPGEIDISEVVLDREHDVVVTPEVPTIRATAPIFTRDGQFFGIVIINVDLRPAFDRIRSARHEGERIYVVNERGDYLVHPDRRREFGFEHGKLFRVQDDFPEFASMMSMTETPPRVIEDRSGERFGIGWQDIRLAGGPKVFVIEAAPYAEVLSATTAVRNSSLAGGLAAVLGAIILAVFIARSLIRPLVQMTAAVEGFAGDEGMNVPTKASGEIGVLARAFERVAVEVRDKTTALTQEIVQRRRLFETSLDLILITDRHGNFIQVSPSSTAILGYRPEQMIGHSGGQFIYCDDLEATRNEMRLARRGRHTRNFETRYVHENGHIVILAWTAVWSEPEQQHFFIGRDITERKQLEETERQAKETLAAVIDASPVAIVCVAPDRRVIVWSRAAEKIFGYTAEETIGQPYKLVPPGQEAEFDRLFERALSGEILRDVQTQRQRKDGSLVDISFASAPMYNSNGMRGIAYALADITERKKAEDKLKYLAHYDQLTGLPNRETLRNDLHALIDPSVASHRSSSIAMFDLDGFKDINDTLGHSIGDQLLKEVAERLVTIVAGAARVYRLGGDEFVAVIPECGDPVAIAQIVDSMLSRLADRFELDGQLLHIGASVGIAIAPADGSNVEELIANADLALYDAKSSGGNGYRFFLPVLRAQAQARRELDSELRRAFANNEFELYFQPQLRLGDGAIVGAEALLRWRHPERGVIGPGAFIEALAESPVAHGVGNWILRTACEQVAAWHAMNLPKIRVGVNLFPAQFHDGTLLGDVEAALLQTGLPAEALELEVTENIALGQDEAMLASLRTLREKGVGLAFDDFGTGYASLSYLTRYPLSRIKIDQSFVRKISDSHSAEDTAIVRSIIVMAHNLGLEVTAEGVETPAQAAFLQAQGCEEVQGFLYARPLPIAEFERFLRSHQIDDQERITGRPDSGKRDIRQKRIG